MVLQDEGPLPLICDNVLKDVTLNFLACMEEMNQSFLLIFTSHLLACATLNADYRYTVCCMFKQAFSS